MASNESNGILITGGMGQLGRVLTRRLPGMLGDRLIMNIDRREVPSSPDGERWDAATIAAYGATECHRVSLSHVDDIVELASGRIGIIIHLASHKLDDAVREEAFETARITDYALQIRQRIGAQIFVLLSS